MAGAGASHRGAVNGTPFLSVFQCDCFENMATGTHNRVFWWQVLGPPTGVPLTAPFFSRFFSVIVLRIWQQVRTIGCSGGRCWGLHRGAVNGTPFLSVFQCDCFENMATGTHNRVFWWQVLGPPTGVPLRHPFLSVFQCDCFENMATGSHNRVFWWQVLGPPTGVPLTAPLSLGFSV